MSKSVFINHVQDNGTFFILLSAWKKVSDKFTQEEKDALNNAYAGETICPRGVLVEYRKITEPLSTKLQQELDAVAEK